MINEAQKGATFIAHLIEFEIGTKLKEIENNSCVVSSKLCAERALWSSNEVL